MKLLRNLTIAGVTVAKASDACRDKMTASREQYPIENGFWGDCTETSKQMRCKAKCNSDSDVLNARKGKAEIRVKCKDDPPTVLYAFAWNFSSLKCEPAQSECADEIAKLNVTKGSLELFKSGKKGSKYNIVCEDGSKPGFVKCKSGIVSSNIRHFEKRACDKFVCRNNGEDVREVFPIGTGKWECTERNGGTHISCKGKCSKNWKEYTKTQYKVSCSEDSLYGWDFINSISDDGNHPGYFCDSSTPGTYFDRF